MRKRTAISAVQRSESPKEICNPFDSEFEVNRESWEPYIDRLQNQETGLTPSNTVSTRQLYISNQVNRARRKLAELEEVSTLLRSSTMSSRGSSTMLASGTEHDAPNLAAEEEPVDNATDPEASGVKDRLEDAIRQIEGLNDRIRELEMQRRSSWALGLSDEPPPGYTE
jgi:small-conductance mechanosensitive channel